MRPSRLSSPLLLSLALALPIPLASSTPLPPRSLVCANDATTTAGSCVPSSPPRGPPETSPTNAPLPPRRFFPRHPLPALPPSSSKPPPHPRRNPPVAWCAHRTNIYVIITYLAPLPNTPVQSLLRSAYSYILDQVATQGDALVPGGRFAFPTTAGPGVAVASANVNNHQQTWRVLAAAVDALDEWMNRSGRYGAVAFRIFDGENEVGAGRVG